MSNSKLSDTADPPLIHLSEANAGEHRGACTRGPAAIVTDFSATEWHDSVNKGDIVRLSAGHAYSRYFVARLGEPITSPARIDGGGAHTTAGRLVAYDQGVDVAARTSDDDATQFGTASVSVGDEVRIVGRTSGRSTGKVTELCDEKKIHYLHLETRTLPDAVVTTPMSKQFDSGAAVFNDEEEIVGVLIAGNENESVFVPASSVEGALGVEIL